MSAPRTPALLARRDALRDMLRSGVRLHDLRRSAGVGVRVLGKLSGAPTSRGRKTIDRVQP